MGVAALVFAGVLIGGALSVPTSKATLPELLRQPSTQNVAPVTFISRHHAQDELGQVNYGFSHPGQSKNELRDSTGNVAGAYSYIDADDKVVIVEYTAGDKGFQVTSNNLPIAVSDTPEVLAAKLQFVEQYNSAALAAAAANDANNELPAKGSSTSNIAVPVQAISSPVRDTPEVIAAKLQFVEAYNSAALAAANAPDDSTVPSKGTEYRSKVNPSPITDTAEVIAAKLQFVEAYNSAAKAAENPRTDGSSKVTIVYGLPVVQDTPEVLAAKLKFVEDYNAAALSASLALDDKVPSITEGSRDEEEEPVTELGIIAEQVPETGTLPPRNDDEHTEPTTSVPGQQGTGKETVKKNYPLIPTKVEGSPDEKPKEAEAESGVAEVRKPETDYSLYKYTYSNSGIHVPQGHTYDVSVPIKPQAPETPAAKTSVLPKPANHPNTEDPPIGVPVIHINRHHAQDEVGQVNYGYSYPGQAQHELRDTSGNVAGAYSYVDEENKVIRVEYTAGKDGFQVKSNHLPIAAQDTPEVLAAKLQFVEAYNAAAIAAANAPDDPPESALLDEDSTSALFIIPNPVQDTPEVLDAKLQFVEAYNAAALAAANAPDDPEESVSPEEDFTAVPFVNPNPIKDTPEVLTAKLKFVEAYNAAALAAAEATSDPGQEGIPKATLNYALHPVKDTPEVIAAKIQFVEAYNAAALAAAMAPDEEIPHNEEETGEVQKYTAAEPVPGTDSSADIPVAIPTSLQVPSVAVPGTYISRHHAQDELGQFNYGFHHPGQVKNEVRNADGNVAGAYSYVDSDEKVIHVKYTAGEDGFQVVSNNLPIAPLDTPEVLAAKLQFAEAYNSAALAAAASPDDVEPESSSSNVNFVVPYAVKDTPEVLAAKLQFVEAYNAAALAAANAPDDPSDVDTIDGKSSTQNLVTHTPEVTEAQLNFVEAYNTAAIAAASAEAPDITAKIAYTSHPVKDTPEVIAAKIAFVQAYNAAALAAAAAPDDDVIYYDTTEEPSEVEAVAVLGEKSTEEPLTDAVLESKNSQNLAVGYLPEVSQPLDDLDKNSEITETVIPRTSSQLQTFNIAFSRYAGYLPGSDGTAPTMYTYSVPYGLYGHHPSTASLKGFPFSIYFVPAQLVKQDKGQVNNHVIMYAPSHTH